LDIHLIVNSTARAVSIRRVAQFESQMTVKTHTHT